MIKIEETILKESKEIKKELQDNRSILEPKEKKISNYKTWGEVNDYFTCWDETKDNFIW